MIITVYLSTLVSKNEAKRADCPDDTTSITKEMAILGFDNGKEDNAYCYCTADFVNRLKE